ncbi:hypothetical protein JCM4814A_88910 [Streptomyces phaeofaciens JCM 4814]|uniref:Uncharacterized protein n=1 Tax=Streptomyces phaeofaciens TaxID=68254 RepID=A0A918HKT7_9ACTN|nr:hypothetical protein [Streptomyces phaeofaciens]GGT70020.1 hypothetical protein GCM10010226_54790 [Streptomyces phaeofaciens]
MERRKLIGIGVGLAVLPAWWALRQVTSGAGEDWHTDTAPLERAFPLLGPLTDAKWVSSRDNDRGVPSPELVISGLARLTPGKLAELTAAHAFVSEGPVIDFSSWFEKPLKGEGPENPQWIRSDELDRDGSGYSTKLWFDRRSDTVRFSALNPYG